MADTKISALTAGAPALSTDEFPVARSGANRKLLISDILTYINANMVLPQTVAEVQANNSTYTEGSWVKVTDNIGGLGGSSGTMFEVGPGGFIVGTGWCRTYLSGAMDNARGVWIDWDATTDFVSRIFEPKQGNTVTAFYNTAGLTGFPFDTTTIEQCTLIDPVVCSINTAAIIYGATFGASATITLGAGTTFRGTAGQEATVTLSDTATFVGEVGDNGGVTLIGTQSLTWCKVGVNKNVDCSTLPSNYTQTGKVYEGPYSTFECTEEIDVNGLTELNITNVNGTQDFSFCGIFTNLLDTGGPDLITTFTTNQTGHRYIIYKADNTQIDFDEGGNIYTPASSVLSASLLGCCYGLTYNALLNGWNINGDTFTH